MSKWQRFASIALPIYGLAGITTSVGLSFLKEKIENTLSKEPNKILNQIKCLVGNKKSYALKQT